MESRTGPCGGGSHLRKGDWVLIKSPSGSIRMSRRWVDGESLPETEWTTLSDLDDVATMREQIKDDPWYHFDRKTNQWVLWEDSRG